MIHFAALSTKGPTTSADLGTGVSDRVGRKPVLLLGCTGTVLSLVVVGFSSSFWMALAGRALGGLLNGNIGVIQTMVGELVTLKEHERMSIPNDHARRRFSLKESCLLVSLD